jgi:LAGLIDADG DNA endonuclease family protein
MSRVSDFDAGFICGLVAGEGSFTGDYKQPVLCIKLHQDDLQPLRFIQEKLGGRIYGHTAMTVDVIISGA